MLGHTHCDDGIARATPIGARVAFATQANLLAILHTSRNTGLNGVARGPLEGDIGPGNCCLQIKCHPGNDVATFRGLAISGESATATEQAGEQVTEISVATPARCAFAKHAAKNVIEAALGTTSREAWSPGCHRPNLVILAALSCI